MKGGGGVSCFTVAAITLTWYSIRPSGVDALDCLPLRRKIHLTCTTSALYSWHGQKQSDRRRRCGQRLTHFAQVNRDRHLLHTSFLFVSPAFAVKEELLTSDRSLYHRNAGKSGKRVMTAVSRFRASTTHLLVLSLTQAFRGHPLDPRRSSSLRCSGCRGHL